MAIYKDADAELIRKIERQRWRGRTDLLWLAKNVLGFTSVEESVHRPLADKLQHFPKPPDAVAQQYDLVTADRIQYIKPYVPMMELPEGRRRLILDPRGFYKCQRLDSLTSMADGSYKPASQVKVHDIIRGVGGDNNLYQRNATVTGVEKQAPQPCYTIKLRSGRAIAVSGNHPFRLINGWVAAKDLVKGDRPALLGQTPEPFEAVSEPSAEIIGWFLGDGHIDGQVVTNESVVFRQRIITAAERAGFTAHENTSNPTRTFYVRCQGLLPLFRSLGLDGKTSGDKFIPERYFKANNASVKQLLYGLYMSDGCCTTSGVMLNTKSERMAHDVQRLLLRFNILSVVYPHTLTKGPYAGNEYFRVSITSAKFVRRFIDCIGWDKGTNYDFEVVGNANHDTVPKQWRDRFGKYLFTHGTKPADMPVNKSLIKYDITKEKLTAYAEALNDDELRLLCSDELFWDEVTEIVYDGEHETIAIETSSGTIAVDDVVTHNTSLNVITHTVQWILNYPDISILIVHARQETAEDMLAELKSHFIHGKVMRQLYPEYCMKEKDAGNRTKFTVPNRQHKQRREATVSIASMDSSVAGLHFDVIKFTDVVDNTNTGTKEQCRKVIYSFSSFKNILVSPKYWIDVEGTCWHQADLYSDIIKKHREAKVEARQWSIHARGVYKKKVRDGKYTFLPEERELPDLLDDQGRKVPWFPAKFPLEELRIMQAEDSQNFANQQLNNPLETETQIFPVMLMRTKSPEDLRKVPMAYYTTSIDTAETQKITSDYSAIVTCGWDGKGRCYVVDVRHGKFLPDELVTEIFDVYKVWRPRHMRIEETGYVRGLKTSIRRYEDIVHMYLPFKFIGADNQKSKEERIMQTLQPWYKRGEIFFDESIPCLEHIRVELSHFPKGNTDDIIDALADQFTDKEWLGREVARANTGDQIATSHGDREEQTRIHLQRLMRKAQNDKINGEGDYAAGGLAAANGWTGFFDLTGGM